MIISEHGDNDHDGESDIDRHVSDTCSPMCRLGAFWYKETACAARLGCVELRRNASVEERRAGAAMLRAFLHLVKRLQASQTELKAALNAQTSQASAQPARQLLDAALFRAGIPHVLVSDGRCGFPQILSFFRLTCSFICSKLKESQIFSVMYGQGGLAIWQGCPMRDCQRECCLITRKALRLHSKSELRSNG